MTQKATSYLSHLFHDILVRVLISGLALVLLNGGFCFSQTCDTWQWRSPTPQGNDLLGATVHNGNLMYCGNKGTVMEKVGASWVRHTPPTLSHLYGIASNGSIIVAVGPNGTILTRTNDQWQVNQVSIDGGFHGFNDVIYAEGQFVAIARSAKIATSPDGITWTPRSTSVISHLNGIHHDGTHFWVVGTVGVILKSDDGITWDSVASGTTADLYDFAQGNGQWIAAGNSSTLSISGDGINFSEVFVPNATNYRRIGWNGIRFVLVGNDGKVAASSDGMQWTTGSLPESKDLEALEFADGAWQSGGEKGIIYEGDGSEAGWVLKQATISTGSIRSITELGNLVVLIDSNGLIQTSSDLENWSQAHQVPGFSGYAAVSNGTQVLFSGSASKVTLMTAPDTFQTTSLGGFVTHRGAAWWNLQWIIVGDNGSVYTSPDGLNWTPQDSDTTERLWAVVDSPTRLVAVGDQGTIVYSSDGQTWQSATSPTTNRLVTVAWNGSYFFAAGSQGVMLQSFDGIQWSLFNSPFNISIQDIKWGLNMWAVAFIGGDIYTSSDANAWNQAPFGTTNQWHALHSVQNQWVVGGNLGNLVTGSCNLCSAPEILDDPQTLQPCVGDDLVLAPLTGGGPFTQVRWTHNDVILDETGLVLNLDDVTGADSGTYKLQLNNACGLTLQTIADLSVQDPFGFELPTRTIARGLCISEIEAMLSCGSGNFELQWWRADLSEIFNTGNPLTLIPAPQETLELVALATDQTTTQQQMLPFTLLVSQDPQLFDFNGDGSNSIADLLEYLPAWGSATPDANGDNTVDVRDFLYINTLGNLFCEPNP